MPFKSASAYVVLGMTGARTVVGFAPVPSLALPCARSRPLACRPSKSEHKRGMMLVFVGRSNPMKEGTLITRSSHEYPQPSLSALAEPS